MPKKQDILLKIHVPGFEKNNPKIEKKRFYFRLNHAIFADYKFTNLDNNARILYIYLLCLCCESGETFIKTSRNTLVRFTKLYGKILERSLKHLDSTLLISITYDPPIVEYSKEKNITLHYKKPKLEFAFAKRQLESALREVGNNEPASEYVCNVLLPLICREFSSSDEFADFLDNIINSKTILGLDPVRSSAYLVGSLQNRLGAKK